MTRSNLWLRMTDWSDRVMLTKSRPSLWLPLVLLSLLVLVAYETLHVTWASLSRLPRDTDG